MTFAPAPQLSGQADSVEYHRSTSASPRLPLCDLSRVVTIASGCGYRFFDLAYTRLGLDGTKHQMGHGYVDGLDGLDHIHNFHAGDRSTLYA